MIKSYNEWLNEGKIPEQGETVKFTKDVSDVQTYNDEELTSKDKIITIMTGKMAEVIFVDEQNVILKCEESGKYISFSTKEYKSLPIKLI